jgi:pilus assembly protein CpaB
MKRLILLSVLFASLTAILFYVYITTLKSKYASKEETVKTVIAKQTIIQGSLIKKNMLAEIDMPKKYRQPKSFNSIDKLFDKDGKSKYIALLTIEENEQILASKVSETNSGTGVSHIIPDGFKALPITFDKESASILKPGNRIDILSVIEYEDSAKKLQESVFIVAQDILVLTVGDNYMGSPARDKKQDYETNNHTITVATTVEEAQIILLAGEKGSLKFILRPIGDNETIDTKTLKMSDLGANISNPISRSQKENEHTKKEILELINKYSNQK